MFKDANIVILTTIASTATGLSFLAAVSSLFPHAPNDAARASLAFSLACIFMMVLGSLLIFATHWISRSRGAHRIIDGITSALALAVFIGGLCVSADLFFKGLDGWLPDDLIMPKSVRKFLRPLLLVPFLWLLVTTFLSFLPNRAKVSKSLPDTQD